MSSFTFVELVTVPPDVVWGARSNAKAGTKLTADFVVAEGFSGHAELWVGDELLVPELISATRLQIDLPRELSGRATLELVDEVGNRSVPLAFTITPADVVVDPGTPPYPTLPDHPRPRPPWGAPLPGSGEDQTVVDLIRKLRERRRRERIAGATELPVTTSRTEVVTSSSSALALPSSSTELSVSVVSSSPTPFAAARHATTSSARTDLSVETQTSRRTAMKDGVNDLEELAAILNLL